MTTRVKATGVVDTIEEEGLDVFGRGDGSNSLSHDLGSDRLIRHTTYRLNLVLNSMQQKDVARRTAERPMFELILNRTSDEDCTVRSGFSAPVYGLSGNVGHSLIFLFLRQPMITVVQLLR